VVAQEGANNVGYRLQEGSPVTAQVGAFETVGYRLQEGSLVLAQEGVKPWFVGRKRAA
jgi:hypothetical protein